MERRDVANKSDMNRNIALQRMQQAMSVAASGSSHTGNVPTPDGNPRSVTGHHAGPVVIPDAHFHEGGSSVQGHLEAERSGPADSHDQAQHNVPDGGGQMQLRRTNNAGAGNAGSAANLVASALTAFEAAKEIMESLRNKHTNLANELEVYTFGLDSMIDNFLLYFFLDCQMFTSKYLLQGFLF
jgi:transformation/transcription domain-associated protein